jgi:hypothetical protein
MRFNLQGARFIGPVIFVAMVASLVAEVGTAVAAASHPTPPANTCKPFTALDANNFNRKSVRITNQFFPLTPGTQFTLEGRDNRLGRPTQHTVVTTVTDVFKRVDGVVTLALWDRDFGSGKLQEDELAFFAQDKHGNVWNLGEFPEEIENGKFAGAPSTWISGQNAVGGIHMLANPEPRVPRYLQGFSPSIDFLDCAQVFARNQRNICVPVGCFNNVLVTDETSPLEDPNAHQRKFHAPGIGIVKVTAVDDPEGETLVLTKHTHLSEHARAEARAAALKLDADGFRHSGVYRHTEPAFVCPPDDGDRLAQNLINRNSDKDDKHDEDPCRSPQES